MDYNFITGATGYTGKAFAEEFARRGENLILTGRSEKKLSDLKNQLASINPNIHVVIYPCQLTDEADRLKMTDDIIKNGYKLKRIVNVAGVDIQKAFCEYTHDKVVFQVRVNSEAAISLTYDLLSLLSEGSEIITVSSLSCITPMPYFAVYAATKNCLTWFFTALRLELEERKINVTTVLPGGIYTRPDVVEEIKRQGLEGKLSSKSPEFIVKKSLAGARKNKAIVIPGAYNKLIYFVTKAVPRRLAMRFVKNRWKNLSDDAF